MFHLPRAARLGKSAHADQAERELTLPRVPYNDNATYRIDPARFPRPAQRTLPELHDLSYQDPRLIRQPGASPMKAACRMATLSLAIGLAFAQEEAQPSTAKRAEINGSMEFGYRWMPGKGGS